jgi:TP901 family phage tail tape measure protein
MVDDVSANIGVNIDTSSAIASLKNLQREISLFHTQMARGGATANAQAAQLQSNLLNAVNATGQFQASMTRVNSTTEAFTTALEKNKLTMGQYFRYAGGASKTFGRAFKSEFDTISKVAVERVKDLQTQYISMGRDANGALQSIKIRPLSLDMQDLSTKTMIAAQKQQLYNQLLKQGSTNLLNFGKNTQWAGRQLMVGFTLPLTLFASTAAKSFMEIEKQIIKIRRVYGDFNTTVEETDQMIESIKTLASEYTKYGVAVSDTLGLASEAAAMGQTGQELLAQISEATRLAVLGNVEQTQALETTISITNAFGVATEDLANKIDFLNAVENQSVTSIEDLTIAIPKAGPVVQQLGGDVEDLAFFLTAMKEGGINASEGANALKSGLAALINPTGKAKEMLQGFGINIEKIVESNKGDVKGLVIDFASALDTLDPLNRARAIEQLFGKFQFSRLSTLFQNVIGEGTQASRVLELAKSTTQELAILSQRELKKVEETTTFKFEKAFADFQAALAPVGEQFLKAVTPIIEFGTKLLNQFNSMGDGAKSFTVILTTVVAGIGPVLLMTVGLVANGVANLIKMFQLLGGIFRKTGADTGILGVQTDYMTQQQIEAAAVAASLNQSHSKLTQTFSVEAAALNSLTAAYQRAITAQRGFGAGGSTTRSSTKPKKYAEGVISVPGPKGAGDIVPAMLAPGEAVIPAKMAKKYGGLISGMVSGDIPGYQTGKIDFAHLGSGRQVTAKSLLASGSMVPPHIVKNLQELSRVLPNAVVNLKNAYGVNMDPSVNRSLGKAQGAMAGDVAKQFTGKDIGSRYGEMAKLSGADINNSSLQKQLATYDKTMAAKIKALQKDGVTRIVDTEKQLKALPENQRKLTRSLESLDSQVIKEIGKENKQLVNLRQKAMSTVRDIRIGEGLSQAEKAKLLKDKRASAVLSRRVSSKGDARRIWRSFQSKTTGGFMAMPGETSGAVTPQQKAAETRRRNAEIKAATTQAQQDKRSAYNARRRERYAEQRAAAQSAAQPVAKKPGIGSRIASGVKGVATRVGPMGGMMAAGAVGAGVSMIPGLEGLGMGISIIGPLLMMLPGPIGLAVAALGLFGAGIFASIKAQEEQRKKAIELGNAQVMSINSMNKMAEDMGTVSATQAREAEMSAKLTSVKEEELTAGQQYIRETESGKKLLSDVKTMQDSGMNVKQIATTVATNLGNAVAQNVITQQQGTEIIAALGVESGNFGISSVASQQFAGYTADLTQASTLTSGAALTQAIEDFNSNVNGTAGFTGLTEMFFGSGRTNDRNVARTASTATINAYGQAVGGTDAINSQFDTLVKEAKTKEEITDLETRRTEELQKQREIESKAYEAIKSQKDILGEFDFNNNFLASVEATFSKDSPMYKTAEKVNSLGDSDFKLRLQTQLESGTLSSQSIDVLLKNAEQDEGFGTSYSLAIEAVGEVALLNMISSLQAGGVGVTKQKVIMDLVTETGSQELADIVSMAAIGEEGVNVSATIDYISKNSDKVLTDWESWEGMSDEEKTVRLQFETNGFSLTKDQWNEYAGLPDYQQKAFVTKYVTEELELRATFTMSNGVFNLRGYEAARDRLYGEAMETARSTSAPITDDGDSGNDGGSGGGGEKEDKKLAKYNKSLDKNQKALNVINLKEDAINKKYDERKKALEEIARINAQISDQQRAQLDVASALASGDIAAAARAIQTEKARAAQFAQEQQMKALEEQKQSEIDNIVVNGKTKAVYEAEIARLNLKIAERELALALASTSGGGSGGGSGGSSGGSSSGNNNSNNGRDTTPDPPARTVNPAYTTAMATKKKLEDQIKSFNAQIEELNSVIAKALRDFRENKISAGVKDARIQNARKQISSITYSKSLTARALRELVIPRQYLASGGTVKYAMGGKIAQKYMASGGSLGSDIVPAMLTPGEFVVKRPAVQGFGVKNLEKINSGKSLSGSVYNYNVNVNVATGSDPDKIARSVVTKIKSIDKQRLGGNNY